MLSVSRSKFVHSPARNDAVLPVTDIPDARPGPTTPSIIIIIIISSSSSHKQSYIRYNTWYACLYKNATSYNYIAKLETRSVEHGICPITEFTSPLLSCAAILAIRP